MVYGPEEQELDIAWSLLSSPSCAGRHGAALGYLREFVKAAISCIPCRAAAPQGDVHMAVPSSSQGTVELSRIAREKGLPLRNAALGLPEDMAGFSFEARLAFSEGTTFLLLSDGGTGFLCAWNGGRAFYADPVHLSPLRGIVRDEARQDVVRPQADLTLTPNVDLGVSRYAQAARIQAQAQAASRAPATGMRDLVLAGFTTTYEDGILVLRLEEEGRVLTVRSAQGRSVAFARDYLGTVCDETGTVVREASGNAEAMMEMLEASRQPVPRPR